MAKQTTSFRLEPAVHRRLKQLSLDWDMPVGDVIFALLTFVTTLGKKDYPEKVKKSINIDFETAIAAASKSGVWFNEEMKIFK